MGLLKEFAIQLYSVRGEAAKDFTATVGRLAAIGYTEIANYLDGQSRLETTVENITTRTRQYAKRQTAWIQHQLHPVWLDTAPAEPLEQLADRVYTAWQQLGPTPLFL